MEKTNFSILLFLFLFTSLCDSQDYTYDEYNYYYDEYNYDNYNGYQNLPAPAPLPISPPTHPPPPPPPPMMPPPTTGNEIFVY